ncbi:3'-5' exonuclease [Cognatishimia sp. F0-27]|uniref:3'-5' exonuclease n=1 Tax=Cognatishimia sp. F0-27 TaxID=2816855 RepID=UPI001D0C7CD8|nr:3'-5' exonuclease [Cognatishimia sp. F0-27]MCC1491490.1 3'-5' exonuclease [Cognatishimia sp. F0-27]
MLTSLSLRLRIFLFFCLLALGGAALAGLALWFGWSRTDPPVPASGFITAFAAFAFLNTGLALAVWLLFDENVAKPIERLASELRLRAHAGVDRAVDTSVAKYLGDLAPAAEAVTTSLNASVLDSAAQVARETERLQGEAARLTALLTEIPVAMILVNPSNCIVLYDGQAAEVLAQIAPPRLKAPLSDYFDADNIAQARETLRQTRKEVAFDLRDRSGAQTFDAKLKPLEGEGYLLVIDTAAMALRPAESRPLVYDFALMDAVETGDIHETALRDLCFVAFDSETTGLDPQKDDVVQLGAVRVLNGRIVDGETLDTYVDPGRPIPAASTRIHGICDADVAGAPDFAKACSAFHAFARDAVLVAHNAPFDIAFLRRYENRLGLEWDHPVLDTVLLSAVVFGTTESHTLDALCDRLGITIPDALRHTALGDARATAEALVKLIPLLEGRGLTTFGALITETRKHGRLLEDLN